MAGILDKKTRIFDYILTREGRSQLKADGDLRFVYATISDRGIEYLEKQSVNKLTFNDKFESFTTSSLKISDSERVYFGFESTSTNSDSLNPEYNLVGGVSYPKSTQNVVDTFGLNQFSKDSNLENIAMSMTGSFTDKFKALKLIDTQSQIKQDEIIVNNIEELNNILYDFNNQNIEDYPTIVSEVLNLSSINSLKDDLRFSHKNNFKKLIPVNKDNSQLLTDNGSLNISDLPQYIFKKYKSKVSITGNETRENMIKKLVRSLESNKKIYGTKFEVLNPTENDLWITQIYEKDLENARLNDKLATIDLGEFYFEEQGIKKQVLLFGKIYKSRSSLINERDSLNDPVYQKEYVLSQEYSFINIFTMVIE